MPSKVLTHEELRELGIPNVLVPDREGQERLKRELDRLRDEQLAYWREQPVLYFD